MTGCAPFINSEEKDAIENITDDRNNELRQEKKESKCPNQALEMDWAKPCRFRKAAFDR